MLRNKILRNRLILLHLSYKNTHGIQRNISKRVFILHNRHFSTTKTKQEVFHIKDNKEPNTSHNEKEYVYINSDSPHEQSLHFLTHTSPSVNTVKINSEISPKRDEKEENEINFVTEQKFNYVWLPLIKEYCLDVNNYDIPINIVDKSIKFTLPQFMKVLYSLIEHKRLLDVHKIFLSNTSLLHIWRHDNSLRDMYKDLLELMLDVEKELLNFETIEIVFSEYIKIPSPKAKYITIGLRAFIDNNEFQLAKAFYMQSLTHPGNFPMTPNDLHQFLLEISHYNDLPNTNLFFGTWLSARCVEKDDVTNYPLIETMQLVHGMILLFQDKVQLSQFINNVIVQKSGYLQSVEFELTQYLNKVWRVLSDVNPETEERDTLFNNLPEYLNLLLHTPIKRTNFYSKLLDYCTISRDIQKFTEVVAVIEKDVGVNMDVTVKEKVGQILSRSRKFTTALEYYEDLIINGSDGALLPIKHSYLNDLWYCITLDYPVLIKVIANELRLTLNKKKYHYHFPWLKFYLQKITQIKMSKINGGIGWNALNLRDAEYGNLMTLDRAIKQRDTKTVDLIIQQTMRDGLVPNFHFYYTLVKALLKNSLITSAKIVDDNIRKSYHSIPEKLNILWLRNDITTRSKGKELSHTEMRRMIAGILRGYMDSKKKSLGYRDYIELTHLAIDFSQYTLADRCLELAWNNFQNKKNAIDWKIFYMTSIKLSTRELDLEDVMETIRQWIKNKDAYILTHGSIRRIKGYLAYFPKKLGDSPDLDKAMLDRAYQDLNVLKTKYLDYKFQGLNDMKRLCNFIETAFDKEIERLHNKKGEIIKESTKNN